MDNSPVPRRGSNPIIFWGRSVLVLDLIVLVLFEVTGYRSGQKVLDWILPVVLVAAILLFRWDRGRRNEFK
jgi:hypothetical protein